MVPVLLLVTAAAAVLAIAAAFHLAVHHKLEPRIRPRRIAFLSVLFWLWYLAPGLSERSALASVLSLLAR